MSEWFIARNGEQEGPLTALQVSEMLSSGELRAGEAMAWKEGMSDWKKLTESGVLAEASMAGVTRSDGLAVPSGVQRQTSAPAQPAQPQQPTGSNINVNPYSTPSTTAVSSGAFDSVIEYPGIGRLAYFLLQLALSVVTYGLILVSVFAVASSSGVEAMGVVALGVVLVSAAGGLWIGVKRVQNLGMSGWAVLWSLVPIMNIWIGWRMFACPPGYDDHKQLDTAGKVLTWIMVGFFILAIVANVMAVFQVDSTY